MERLQVQQAFEHETRTIYPIQLLHLKGLQEVPAPFVRISTCGMLTLEVFQEVVSTAPLLGRYEVLSPANLRGRGIVPALTLLKLFVSQPHRFASKDWLAEKLRRGNSRDDEDEGGSYGVGRLDNIASILRDLFVCPCEQREDLEKLRVLLVTFLRNGKESGPGYQLAPYPLIWLDTEAIAWNVERGAIFDSFADENALPFWERAYELASRGVYLADERYSDWVHTKRQEVQGHLRQSVQVLYRRYLSLFGERGEERAMLLLRTYALAHPTEEDVVRPLMELLGKRECYQEAFDYYHRLSHLVEEEGREPDPRTQKIEIYLRTRQNQRERVTTNHLQTIKLPNASSVFPAKRHNETHALPQNFVETLQASHHTVNLLSEMAGSSGEQSLGVCLAQAARHLSVLFNDGWQIEAVEEALRIVLPVVKTMPQRVLYEHTSVIKDQSPPVLRKQALHEEQMLLCRSLGESIEASWKLFHITSIPEMFVVGEALLYLMQYNHASLYSPVRPLLYSAVYQLIGASLYFLGDFQKALQALEQSYITGLQGANVWHMAQSLSWQAYVWKDMGDYTQAFEATDEALRLISQRNDSECIRLRARLLALGAESAALMQDSTEVDNRLRASKGLLEQLPSLHEEFDHVSWLQQAGACALNLEDYLSAIRYLEQALDTLPSGWLLRYAATSIPLAKALTRTGKVEQAITIARKTLPILTSAHARLLTGQFLNYLNDDLLTMFPHDTQCEALVVEAQQRLMLL